MIITTHLQFVKRTLAAVALLMAAAAPATPQARDLRGNYNPKSGLITVSIESGIDIKIVTTDAVRAGAGENPVSAAGEEQCEAGARETGSGSGLAPDRAAPAGGDESAAAGAASEDPGGPGRVGRLGPGAGGLAAGRGALGVGAASEAAWQGARGTGETEQAGVVGALRASPAAAGILGERLPRGAGALQAMAGAGRQSARDRRAIRGDKEVLGRFRAELEDRLRWQRVSLGKEHFEAVRGIESKAGEFYREGLEGSEKRARQAARSDGISVRYGWRRDEFDTFKYSMLEERLEQVREIDGELAYEKMRRAVEKASQEKASQEKARQARQVERARLEWARQETARQSRDRRGPERRGPERDFGPSR